MGEPNKKLWIGNLSYKVAKDDLDVLFRQHGAIVDIKLLDKGPHVYAFVEYEKQDSAVEAYEKLQSRELKGNAMKIEYANGRKRYKIEFILEPIIEIEIQEETVILIEREIITVDDPGVIAMTGINRNLKVQLLLSTFTFLGHRRRSSSSESSRHRKISKQNRNKPKSPDDSGLSQS